MKGLERFPEPWSVQIGDDGTVIVKDARGFTLLSIKSRDDIKRFDNAENAMNSTEGLALARAIANLSELERRPQY